MQKDELRGRCADDRVVTEHVPARRARALEARADTRRRLLDAAEVCSPTLGYHDASIVKITEAAGVAQGTFYLYFASKRTSSTSSSAT